MIKKKIEVDRALHSNASDPDDFYKTLEDVNWMQIAKGSTIYEGEDKFLGF